MSEHARVRHGREVPLPAALQGSWIDADDPGSELQIYGGEIRCFSEVIEYDFKDIVEESGALTVTLGTHDDTARDEFERANITGLVVTPDGELHAYNVKFASRFVRVAG